MRLQAYSPFTISPTIAEKWRICCVHLLWAEYDSVLLYSNGTAKTTFLGVRIWHVIPHPGSPILELKTRLSVGHQVDKRASLLLHPL